MLREVGGRPLFNLLAAGGVGGRGGGGVWSAWVFDCHAGGRRCMRPSKPGIGSPFRNDGRCKRNPPRKDIAISNVSTSTYTYIHIGYWIFIFDIDIVIFDIFE